MLINEATETCKLFSLSLPPHFFLFFFVFLTKAEKLNMWQVFLRGEGDL